MAATEHDNIAELIATHQARLHQLQLTQATMGSATPPYVALDIAQATRAIEQLSGQPVEMSVREKYLIDQQWQMRIDGDLFKLDRKIDEVLNLFHQLLAALALRGLTPQPQPRPRQSRRANGE
jgi:hypothetical protein